MANMTLAEAEAQLLTVNVAISQMIAGTSLKELKVGNGAFTRYYVYNEITFDNLYTLRNELRSIIASYQPTVAPVFRTNCCIPLVISK